MPQTRPHHDSPATPSAFEPLLGRLRCPACGGALASASAGLACGGCAAVWPVRDGIACLAREGTVETWTTPAEGETSAAYQQRYREPAAAARYNQTYRDAPTKRFSTARERRLLERLLGRLGPVELLLDLPCGGGRLSAALARRAERLVEADVALGQVAHARDQRGDWAATYMTASAFHIPFRDGGVDATVCCRLCHHLPAASERERLIAELLRVSRRGVVLTFFDHHSLKNVIRRARGPFDRKPPKATMTLARVAELAHAHGADLVAAPPLSRLFSGHRFALMVKRRY